MYDPLDREIWNCDEEPLVQNIKSIELKYKISEELKPVDSQRMNAPLSKKALSVLESLFIHY